MPDPTPDPTPIQLIPLDAIDAEAVARDRTRLDDDALAELASSIACGGLRQPIEVFALSEPRGAQRYGLISGFRRLRAVRALHTANPARFAAIPAFVRTPGTVADVLAAMVEENDVRADLSPWERGAIAARAVRHGHFPDLPEALRALYPHANRHKRGRLRIIAELVLEMGGLLSEPERLRERDCLRYAAAVSAGFADFIEQALDEAGTREHAAQWAIVEAIIRESEAFPEDHPLVDGRPNRKPVRRFASSPRHRLSVRRERTRGGFVLHVTGRDATTPLVNEMFEEIERRFRAG